MELQLQAQHRKRRASTTAYGESGKAKRSTARRTGSQGEFMWSTLVYIVHVDASIHYLSRRLVRI